MKGNQKIIDKYRRENDKIRHMLELVLIRKGVYKWKLKPEYATDYPHLAEKYK